MSSRTSVTLVIPGRNAEATLGACLQSAQPLLASGELAEIIFVDDGSQDRTREICGTFSQVKYLNADGRGVGAARNLGALHAQTDFVWFVDADCVLQPNSLKWLVNSLGSDFVAIGGSYANERPESYLASLIHAEILARHHRMSARVSALGGYNVMYRRTEFLRVGGFDNGTFNRRGCSGAEDFDLSYRLEALGYRLGFEIKSRVGHHHPTALVPYLKKQYQHGVFRMLLACDHPQKLSGDNYTDVWDLLQPILLALLFFGLFVNWPMTAILFACFIGVHLPMSFRVLHQSNPALAVYFIPFSVIRTIARTMGMLVGAALVCSSRLVNSKKRSGLVSRDRANRSVL